MTAKPRKPLLVNLTWAVIALVGLAVLYVLSYAPAHRMLFGHVPLIGAVDPINTKTSMPDTRIPAYMPVNWLIDHTPLREPLFWWAGVFGVEEDFRDAHSSRAWASRRHP